MIEYASPARLDCGPVRGGKGLDSDNASEYGSGFPFALTMQTA